MKKTVSFLLVLALALTACKSKTQQEKHSSKIAVVVSTLNNPCFVFLAETSAVWQKHWVG